MKSNDYHFVSNWRVEADIWEVSDIIGGDARELTRWWPSVYLDVKILEEGDAGGVGRVVELYTKGWLPYTLRWRFRVTASNEPNGFALEASGDFAGTGVWRFAQAGKYVDIVYDWRIAAEKGLLKHLSFLMKPLFAANHRWAMQKGYESLLLELQRQRALQSGQAIPGFGPPQPTFPHNFTNNKIL